MKSILSDEILLSKAYNMIYEKDKERNTEMWSNENDDIADLMVNFFKSIRGSFYISEYL
jgi:virulence-associated protein VapD